jgi:hypothetical protein
MLTLDYDMNQKGTILVLLVTGMASVRWRRVMLIYGIRDSLLGS